MRIRAIILAITGFVISLLIVRLLLVLFSADTLEPLIKFVFDLTDPLVAPFIPENAVQIIGSLDIGLLLAMLVYMVIGILIS